MPFILVQYSGFMAKKYRSSEWFGKTDKMGFIYRSWMRNQGLPDHSFDGRPVIGICNTWSELTPCNSGLRDLADTHGSRLVGHGFVGLLLLLLLLVLRRNSAVA